MSLQRVKSAGRERKTYHLLYPCLRRERSSRKRKWNSREVDFQARSSHLEPLDPCFEVRFLIYSCCSYCSSSCIAWSSMFHEPCIALKFGFRKRKWYSCVLEEKPCFDPKVCIKIHVFVFVFIWSSGMGTKVHVFELIAWNPRSCNNKLWF